MKTKTEEVPSAEWNIWALLNTPEAKALTGVGRLIADRLDAVAGEFNPGPRSFVVICTGGNWGRGKTLAEAAKNSKSPRAERAHAYVVLNDDKPSVDGWGRITGSSSSAIISVGWVGTVGSILNANK